MLIDDYSVKTGTVKGHPYVLYQGFCRKENLLYSYIIISYMPDKKKLIIAMTGATGFLGSHLMASMLSEGYSIIVLGRSAKEETLKERISSLLGWFGIKSRIDQVTCIDTDLSKDKLGIADAEYSRLCSSVNSVIHCASDTSFSENKREKVITANIENLKGILEF